MSNDAMQIRHTKKGMKKLIKNLYLLQMNYVSVGIHRKDNKITSGAKQSKDWKKLQNHLKKMGQEDGGSNSSPNSGSGLDKDNSNEIHTRNRNRSYNLASLAYYLEQSVSWIQGKTVRLLAKDGSQVTINKGARITRPARVFIRLFKLPTIWNKIRLFIQRQVRNLYVSAGTNKKQFWTAVGMMTKLEQKGVIQTSNSAANSDITTKLKGQNHPLFDTGGLLNAIDYKVEKNYNGGTKIAKNKFLMQLDEEMGKLR